MAPRPTSTLSLLAPKATVAAAITKVKGVDVTANGNDASQHPMYQVTLSTDLNSTYFTASDISYQGDNVKKVELVVLDKDGNIAMVDGAPQIATVKSLLPRSPAITGSAP